MKSGASTQQLQLIHADRMFMLDPASRFFDSNDAGKQTSAMTRILPEANYPVYTCELDERVT